MICTFDCFNLCDIDKHHRFYDAICNIASGEYSKIEALSAKIKMLFSRKTPRIGGSKSSIGSSGSARKGARAAGANSRKAAKREISNRATPATSTPLCTRSKPERSSLSL